MEVQLTADEQRYLAAAFAQSPREWFRPGGIEHAMFSRTQSSGLVASLVAAGLLDGEPDCHARLTERGRKEAARLTRQENHRRSESFVSARRRRAITHFAIASAALLLCLAVLRWTHLI